MSIFLFFGALSAIFCQMSVHILPCIWGLGFLVYFRETTTKTSPRVHSRSRASISKEERALSLSPSLSLSRHRGVGTVKWGNFTEIAYLNSVLTLDRGQKSDDGLALKIPQWLSKFALLHLFPCKSCHLPIKRTDTTHPSSAPLMAW